MRLYLEKTFVIFLLILLPVVGLLGAVDLAFRPRKFDAFLFALVILPVLVFKTNWYLLFPHSRRYLLAVHALESLLLSSCTAGAIFLLHWMHGRLSPGLQVPSFPIPILLASSFMMLIRVLVPIQKLAGTNNALFKREIASRGIGIGQLKGLTSIASVYVVGMAILTTPLREEPMVWIAIAVGLIAFAPCLPLSILVLPSRTFLKWRTAGLIGALIVNLGILVAAISFSLWGNPKKMGTRVAFQILGRIQVPLDQTRLMSLAMTPNGPVSNQFKKIEESLKSSITEREWNERTEACRSADCLDVSDELIPMSLPEGKKIERFYELIKHCQPGLIDESFLRCKGSKLSGIRLGRWLNFLEVSNTIDAWIASSDPLRQFVAIRILSSKPLSPTQKSRIIELQEASDSAVRVAARLYMTFYDCQPGLVKAESSTEKSGSGCKKVDPVDLF